MANKYALDPGVRVMLIDMGMRPGSILRRAGLRADLLAGGPVWLTQDEFFSMWRAMEAESDEPNLPLLIEHAFAPGAFTPMIFAVTVSPDLTTAAGRIADYKKLTGDSRIQVDTADGETTISYEWPAGAEPPATMVLTDLLFWVAAARTGTRERVVPLRVTAPQPPDDTAAYRAYLGVEVEESQLPSVVFSETDAMRPFLTANDAMWESFEPSLRRRLSEVEVDAGNADRVRAALLELLPGGRTTVTDVAKELAISTRTLHRRLKTEDTTFQSILDATREELARHYLASPDMSAQDISFLLGYEDTSSFYRAFQNWTGETPARVREQMATA